uniref:Uncharacterized protein n=1 Tax=Fagus sylvatica TaxID=28930 RepID=A0A2N9JBV4_FAGSY
MTSLKPSNKTRKPLLSKSLTVPFALTESSDSTNSLQPNTNTNTNKNIQSLLQQLADSFELPQDYFSQLPGDLRLDLNDAAFDLSNGPVLDEMCPTIMLQDPGRVSNHSIELQLIFMDWPFLKLLNLVDIQRLESAGRRFQSMGQYGKGELQKIAKVMITTGRLLSASSVSPAAEEQPEETRMLKFGELQVELTSDKANIGAAIGIAFGILSWQLGQGVQSILESSLQYANDNALLLAKSLRGALLALCYSSAVLSAFTSVGLVILGRQLKSKD